MDLQTILDIIANLGFPIAAVIAMGIFIWHIFNKTTAQNEENMKRVLDRCKEREEILYKEIAQNREINAQAIETIAHYAEKLEQIQEDVKEIKTDITVIMAKQ